MGQTHAAVLFKHPLASLAAVTDTNPAKRKIAQQLGCTWFDRPEQMMASGEVDTVIIATPHWQHAELSLAAFNADLNVICEKPLAVTVAQADEVVRAARSSKRLFAVVHQSRFEPAYQQAKQLLESGELGSLVRCSMIETTWRSDAYYRSEPWRGTWKGEGGGVLINQAEHVLDRYFWLFGMPASLVGQCNAALHGIEVEDCASAILHHDGDFHGHIHVSTNECPNLAQTVIACDKGRIVIEGGALRVTRLHRSIREATAEDSRIWAEIDGETQDLGGGLVASIPQLLEAFYENVALAAAGETKLISPGAEAIHAVELANGITLSSALGQKVRFPMSRTDYDRIIAEKTANASMVMPG